MKRHHLVHVCPKCSHSFVKKDQLLVHTNTVKSCANSPNRDYSDGFDEDQLKGLQCRKDKGGSRNEKADERLHWKKIYRILFPETPESELPSPCKAAHCLTLIYAYRETIVHEYATVDLTRPNDFNAQDWHQDLEFINDLARILPNYAIVETVLKLIHEKQALCRQQRLRNSNQPSSWFSGSTLNPGHQGNAEDCGDLQDQAAQMSLQLSSSMAGSTEQSIAGADVSHAQRYDQSYCSLDSDMNTGFQDFDERPRNMNVTDGNVHQSSPTIVEPDSLNWWDFIDPSHVSLGADTETLDSQWTLGRDDVAANTDC